MYLAVVDLGRNPRGQEPRSWDTRSQWDLDEPGVRSWSRMSGNIKDLEREECPKCNKHVYDAEGFPAGGKRFHKRCFKCTTCSKKLDPTSVLVNKSDLYCRGCHSKLGPKDSPKIYTDTSILKPADGKVANIRQIRSIYVTISMQHFI